MQTVEQKYGIPTFETCKKLAKYWSETETLLTIFKGFKESICIDFSDNYFDIRNEYYQAPQIHELLAILPTTILYENYFYDLEIRKECVFYSGLNRDIFEFENDNLAECLAQLYITLKEKGLL